MKKLFIFLAVLTYFTASFAQNNVFVWHNNHTIDVTSFSRGDSITFEAPVASSVTLSTGDPVEVTASSMTAYYVAIGLKFQGVATERGVCYSSVESQPTTNNNKSVDGLYAAGTWKATIEKLDSGRTYYYRAYALIGSDTLYGSVKSFTTHGENTQSSSVPTAVDLGLSVKWASFNLGATKPEEYGGYYAWGETSTKKSYNWSSYKWGTSTNITKYNKEDGLITLSSDDDAATYNLGKPWRIATDEEWRELLSNCSYEWEEMNGVKGLRFISKVNANSIFLPCAGNRGVSYTYWGGRYWSSSVWISMYYYANDYVFLPAGDVKIMDHGNRYEGFSVRPVCP